MCHQAPACPISNPQEVVQLCIAALDFRSRRKSGDGTSSISSQSSGDRLELRSAGAGMRAAFNDCMLQKEIAKLVQVSKGGGGGGLT
jgi:hypothetical protein